MTSTRAHYHNLYQQEAHRLRNINFELPPSLESSNAHIVYHPLFLSTMEEQSLHILAKEQLKTLAKFGGAHDEDIVKWLEDVEEVFDRAKLQPPNKLIAIQSYLIDAAAKWFRYNKSTIAEWSTFKIEIIKAYQPSFNQALLKLEQRQQSSAESVMAYYYDKIQLCRQADANMSPAMIIHYLSKGLTPSLVGHVIRRHPLTPADFLIAAQDEEKIQSTVTGLSSTSTNLPDDYIQDDSSISDTITLVKRPNNLHARSQHQQPQQSYPQPLMSLPSTPTYRSSSIRSYYYPPSSSFSSLQCYTCHRVGHISKYCPNRKNI